MVKPQKKRHLHFDQQEPPEDLKPAERARFTQEVLARRPPTTEDQYFFEQERKSKDRIKNTDQMTARYRAKPPEKKADSDRPSRIWQWVIRVLNRGVDKRWRP